MPLRGPDNKEYDGSQDEWKDEEKEGTGELLKKIRKLRSPTEPEPEPENFQPSPPPPSDDLTAEGIVEQVAELVNKEDILITGETDEETGLLPVILRKAAAVSPAIPARRGRHVGGRALAILSRMPLVGLKYLRDSAEFVVYDDQPPPSGEYVVQALGVTTIEYDGVQQNHLLVTFKAGQLTGFGIENTYDSQESTYALGTDLEIDIATHLGSRSARTIVIECNRNIQVKINTATSDAMSISANQTPFIIDLGLNIDKIFLTTYKDTKVRIKGW
jgi:hypothetical protein